MTTRSTLFILVMLAVLVAAPAAALAGQSSRQTFALAFTTEARNASTGTNARIDFTNPNNPAAKPFAVDRIVLVFPAGSRVNTSVPARCTASDAQLRERGRSACPAGSVVGSGFVRLDTGLSVPFRRRTADVTLLNDTNRVIFLFKDRASDARFVTRGVIDGRALRLRVPELPGGEPDDQTAIDLARLTTRRITNERGRYLTTPATCPASRAWTFSGSFFYNGMRQTETSRSPCRP